MRTTGLRHLADTWNSRPVILDVQVAADYIATLGHVPFDVKSLPSIRPPWECALLSCVDRIMPLSWLVWEVDNNEVRIAAFGHFNSYSRGTLANARVVLDETGRPQYMMAEWQKRPEWASSDRWDYAGSLFTIPLEALAMCHVKWAEITDAVPLRRPGGSLSLRPGKHKKPTYSYHTLKIDAVERFVNNVRTASKRTGSRVHLVRGHYKDFREKGVAGNPKARGIYWTPAHIRGDKSQGMVAKDYTL